MNGRRSLFALTVRTLYDRNHERLSDAFQVEALRTPAVEALRELLDQSTSVMH